MTRFLKIGLIGLALLVSPRAYAIDSDALIEGAKLCTQHLPRFERQYAIPTHLLSAIASTESGRYHEGLKLKLPWPWTINAEGKGYFFKSKQEAIAAVHKFRAQGIQSIDVGCMQVNLYQHAGAFASLDKAFEPEDNIAYAASFLRNLYDEGGTWKKAAADYHSRTPKLGKEYVGLVYDSWFTIIERLRAAKLKIPESSVVGMKDMKETPHVVTVAGNKMKTTPLPEQEGRIVAAYTHPHMNHIQVSSSDDEGATIASRPQSDMLVVKPEIVTADSTPMPAPVARSVPVVDPKIIQVNDTRPIDVTAPQIRKGGPNFIFND